MTNAPAAEPDFDTLWKQEAGQSASPQAQSTAQVPAPAPAAAEPATPEAAPAVPAQVEPQAPATVVAPEVPAPVEDDWVTSLPPEVQEKIAAERTAAQQRYDALHGRVVPLQRQLSRLQTPQRQAAPAAPTPQQQQVVARQEAALEDFFKSPSWTEYEASYPGDAKVMRAGLERQAADTQGKIGTLEQRLGQFESQLVATTSTVQSAALDTQVNMLEAAHPDWREFNNSNEFWDWFFEDWRYNQPKEVRGVYFDDAKLNEMWADHEFAGARIAEYKARATPAPTPAVPATQDGQQHPQPTQAQPTPPAPTAAQVRQSMAASPTIKGGAQVPRGVPVETMTEEERFDALWAAEQAKLNAQ